MTTIDAEHLAPSGLAAVILGVTCALGCLSLVTVTLRTFVRVASSQFGLDDGLMLGGLVLYLADCGVVAYDTFVGLGSKNELITSTAMQLEGIKYMVFWQIFYVTSLCAIKSAICTTLLRIAVVKTHRVIVYGIIVMTCITSLIGFIGVMTSCRPITANWTPGTGQCASTNVITNLSYLVSASSIITDWACAIVPVFILWKTQMNARAKIQVAIVLTLGAVASVTTIARMPFLRYYRELNNDYLYHMGFIILLSIAECGIGLIAGSLPMLRRFFRTCFGRDASQQDSRQTPGSLRTFGGSGGQSDAVRIYRSRGRLVNLTGKGISRTTVKASRPSDEWEQLDDGSSNEGRPPSAEPHAIMAHRTVTVEYEMRNIGESNRPS